MCRQSVIIRFTLFNPKFHFLYLFYYSSSPFQIRWHQGTHLDSENYRTIPIILLGITSSPLKYPTTLCSFRTRHGSLPHRRSTFGAEKYLFLPVAPDLVTSEKLPLLCVYVFQWQFRCKKEKGRRKKKDTHTRLQLLVVNVALLSKHLRAMFGSYLPFVYYRVSSLVHLTGDSIFPHKWFLFNCVCTLDSCYNSLKGVLMICMQVTEICMEIKLLRTRNTQRFPPMLNGKCRTHAA